MNADSRTIRRLADEKLRHALAEGERLRNQLENENDHLRREVTTSQGAPLLVGASTALRQAFDAASQAAPTGRRPARRRDRHRQGAVCVADSRPEPATEPSDGPRQLLGYPIRSHRERAVRP